MIRFVLRRLLAAIPVLVGVAVGVFLMVHLSPGDPAQLIAGDQAPPEVVAAIRHQLGLDQPLAVQLGGYLWRTARGDLGSSIADHRPVTQDLAGPLEVTAELVALATLAAVLISVPAGIFAAIHRGGPLDRLTVAGAVAGNAFPSFWIGLLLMWLLAYHWRVLPIGGWGRPAQLVLPVLTLATVQIAAITRLARSAALEVLRQDYVRTARAKGLRESLVIGKHMLRNAALTIVTVVALQFGYFLGGAVVTETVFAVPGLGRLTVDAIGLRDFPLVQGAVLVFAVCFVLINLLADIAYAVLDPRIRYA